MKTFLDALAEQRWDDHRYYHHSTINQSLHFVSALSFLAAYVVLLVSPAVASLIGWLVAMTSRQAGHFFFEPKGYDHVNQATHEHKEAIKVGYNLRRKVVLHAIWMLSPLLLLVDPSGFGWLEPHQGFTDFALNVGLLWLAIGTIGLLFRVAQLCVIQDLRTGVVWLAKILTDPFHDVKLYWRAPLHVVRGRLILPPAAKH